MPVTIVLRRLLPAYRGWARDRRCRVLAGCYETEPPRVREVYVREQVGEIQGWGFAEWEGKEPVAIKLYVRVEV